MRHAERWKRLAEVLHPGDYADKYPRALAAITAARRNDAPARSGRASRRCWPNGTSPRSRPCCNNVPANSRAGWIVTLRRSTEPGAVLDAFETVAAQASTPILLQVLAQARAPRPCPCGLHARAHWQGLRHPGSP